MAIVALIGYMILLVFGATISPGIGFFGRVIVMLPQFVAELSHALAYGLMAWLLTLGLQRRGWPDVHAVLAGAAGAFVFGMWTEIFQASVPGRVVDAEDLLVNGVGIGMAAWVMFWRAMPVSPSEKTVPAQPCTPIA